MYWEDWYLPQGNVPWKETFPALSLAMSTTSNNLQFIRATVPLFLSEQDAQWVAYCPPLEVSSYGDTQAEATAAFEEALEIFFEETARRGTLELELIRLGWTLTQKRYTPPEISPRRIHRLGTVRRMNRRILILGPGRPNDRTYA